MDWVLFYQRLFIKYSDLHYCRWKARNRNKQISNRDNPYNCGYSQPSWLNEMRNAIGNNDEEKVKAIFAVESQYDSLLLECYNLVNIEAKQ